MSEVKVIGIGNDHAAVDLKNEIKAYLEEKGYKVVNYGTDSSESCDYPVYGAKVGNAVASGEVDAGVLICGTGIGISIAANKINGVRAAVVSEPVSARLTKEHNNANIIGRQYHDIQAGSQNDRQTPWTACKLYAKAKDRYQWFRHAHQYVPVKGWKKYFCG